MYIIDISDIMAIIDITGTSGNNGYNKYKRNNCHKGDKISMYRIETWMLIARDRCRGASARNPGDVGPSMSHVEVAAGESPQPSQPPQVRRADA
jgi:hypothetical protein